MYTCKQIGSLNWTLIDYNCRLNYSYNWNKAVRKEIELEMI